MANARPEHRRQPVLHHHRARGREPRRQPELHDLRPGHRGPRRRQADQRPDADAPTDLRRATDRGRLHREGHDREAKAPAAVARARAADPQSRSTCGSSIPTVAPRASNTSCAAAHDRVQVELRVRGQDHDHGSTPAERRGVERPPRSAASPAIATAGTNGSWYAICGALGGQPLEHRDRGRPAQVVHAGLEGDADAQHASSR